MKRIIEIIKKWEARRAESTRMNTLKEIREEFQLSSTFNAVVIMHGGLVIEEFEPTATSKDILSVLEKYRQVAANNHKF